MKREEWRKSLQVGDAVKVIDFWEEKYKGAITQVTNRFIWVKFEDTKEVIRFSRKTGYQARGGMALHMPDKKGENECVDTAKS